MEVAREMHIKIVPEAEPGARGHWITVTVKCSYGSCPYECEPGECVCPEEVIDGVKTVTLPPAPGKNPDDDSDSAMWAAYHHHRKQRRTARLIDFDKGGRAELEQLLGQKLVQHTEYHFSFTLQNNRVDYWPSSSRWRWKNKAYFGNMRSLCGFVSKRMSKGAKK